MKFIEFIGGVLEGRRWWKTRREASAEMANASLYILALSSRRLNWDVKSPDGMVSSACKDWPSLGNKIGREIHSFGAEASQCTADIITNLNSAVDDDSTISGYYGSARD